MSDWLWQMSEEFIACHSMIFSCLTCAQATSEEESHPNKLHVGSSAWQAKGRPTAAGSDPAQVGCQWIPTHSLQSCGPGRAAVATVNTRTVEKKNKHLSTASAGGKHCYCRRVKKKMHSIHQNIQMFLNRLYFLFVLLTKNCAVFIPCPWFFFFLSLLRTFQSPVLFMSVYQCINVLLVSVY